MSVQIEMSDEEIAGLKYATKSEKDSDAIVRAAREYLRLVRLKELLEAAGSVDFDENWHMTDAPGNQDFRRIGGKVVGKGRILLDDAIGRTVR